MVDLGQDTTFLTGQSIKGYTLHELVGTGNFGAVYRASQTSVGREVAVKVILPKYANDATFIRKFESEARLVARLEHPHIVPLHDYWRDPNGAYLVMRYLSAGSLRRLLSQQNALTIETIERFVSQLCEALNIAHRNQVIHRDIKPDNILVDDDASNAFLTDFGIAKHLSGSTEYAEEDGLTGTPAYASPEQIRSQKLLPASDIYSLAFTIYEMIVGHSPFYDKNIAQIIYAHLEYPIPPHDAIPQPVFDVLKVATAKVAENRYQDAISFAQAFATALASNVISVTPEPIVEINPYKGLRAFEEADSSDFFGRENLVDDLLQKLDEDHRRSNFLALVGPSGSGKSSVVKAGLIPSLREGALPNSQDWFILDMTPSDKPIESLATVLLSIAINPPDNIERTLREKSDGLVQAIRTILTPQQKIFLYIDQFEEVFTNLHDHKTQEHFLALLQTAVEELNEQFILVITLRADFYDRPLLVEGFADLIRTRTAVIVPLNSDELRATIVEPAARVGLNIDQDLLATIVADVQNEPGALPLLQYALTEIFEQRDGNTFTLAAYQAIGGVTGALARRAEEIFLEQDAAEQQVIQQIFMRLVALGEGTEDTRRRATWHELISVAPQVAIVQHVLDTFGKYRLLSFDSDPQSREPTVEVAHEALIRQWGRLRDWLNESRQDIRNQRLLASAAQEWLDSHHDSSFLLRGARLVQFEEWQKDLHLALTQSELEYLMASIAERTKQEEAEQIRQENEQRLEQRAQSRTRNLLVVMSVATLLSIALSAFAFNQQAVARAAEQQAQARANQLLSLNLADQAQQAFDNGDRDTAVALVLNATDINREDPAVERALAFIAYASGTRLLFDNHDGAIFNVIVSPDGQRVLSTSGRLFPTDALNDASVRYWDLNTGEEIWRYSDFNDSVYSVAFSPNGTYAFIGSEDNSLRRINLETQEVDRFYEGHTEAVFSLAVSPNGQYLASASGDVFASVLRIGFQSVDNSVRIWDIETGEQLRIFEGHEAVVLGVWFHPLDENLIFSASGDGTVRIWNIETGEEVQQFDSDGWVSAADISPDGRYVVAATGAPTDTIVRTGAPTIIMWDTETGQEVGRFDGHTEAIISVQFSPDGTRLISSSQDKTVRLWDVDTQEQIEAFSEHTGFVTYTRFVGDGSQAISSSQDGTIRLWDLERGELVQEQDIANSIQDIDVDIESEYAAFILEDGIVQVLDTINNELILDYTPQVDDTIEQVQLNADASQLALGTSTGTIIVLDLPSAEEIMRVAGHNDPIRDLAFSPDGQTIASSSGKPLDIESEDTSIRLWNIETGEEILYIDTPNAPIWSLAFNAEGTQLLSGSGDTVRTTAENIASIWDVTTGEEIQRFVGHNLAVFDANFSPDGTMVVTASADNTIVIWDVETGTEIRRLLGHRDVVYRAIFTPDNRTILSSSDDMSIIQWDVQTGTEIRRFNEPQSPVLIVELGQDGRTALSATTEGTLMWWRIDLTIDDIIEWTQANRYIPTLPCNTLLAESGAICEELEQ